MDSRGQTGEAKSIDEELRAAVSNIDLEKTKELLGLGADPAWRHPIDGETALHAAVKTGSSELVGLLLERDCSGCAAPFFPGWTPFELSALFRNDTVFETLWLAGLATFGRFGDMASRRGSSGNVTCYIKSEPGLSYVAHVGTPFQVRFLLDQGYDPMPATKVAFTRGGKIAEILFGELRKRGVVPKHEDFLACSSSSTAKAGIALLGRDAERVRALAEDDGMTDAVRIVARARLAKIDGMALSKSAVKAQGKEGTRRRL